MSFFVDAWQAVWGMTEAMAPYLLFGFLVAGVLSVSVPPDLVERHLGGRGWRSTLVAALCGVPLPLCSCGVLPVAVSLRRRGASKGAATAFLVSTPQTGVDSVMVTLAMMGPVLAVFRPFAALVSGVLGGVLVDRFAGDDGSAREGRGAERALGDAASPAGSPAWRRALRYGFHDLPASIGADIVKGIVLAGLVALLVPADFFAELPLHPVVQIFVMMAAGIPVYVCATASVPFAAALVAKGLSPGAAVAFLIAGPATNAASLRVLWGALGRRATMLYVGTVAVSAAVSGLAFQAIVRTFGGSMAPGGHEMLPGWLGTVSAVVLLAVLLLPRWPFGHRSAACASCRGEADEAAWTVSVSGMSCEHCAGTVRRAVLACRGVQDVDVSLSRGSVRIRGESCDRVEVLAAIERAGFRATSS